MAQIKRLETLITILLTIGINEDSIMKKIISFTAFAIAVAACSIELVQPEETPEYYTFNAVFESDTKVDFGTPEGGSIALNWKDGDEVGFKLTKSDKSVVTRKGSVSVEGDVVTVTLDLSSAENGWESVVDIWYPYNGGTKLAEIPTSQSYDVVAVPVHKTDMTSSTITFASYLDYVVLEFPVIQTAQFYSGYKDESRYNPVIKKVNSISVGIEGESTYSLDASGDTSISLKEYYNEDNSRLDGNGRLTVDKTYYVIIPPIASKKITVTYTTEDELSFSNTKSGLTLDSGSYRRMPSMDLTGHHLWRFGTSFTNTDCNGLVYWFREVQKPSAAHSIATEYLLPEEKHHTVIPDVDGTTYYYYLTPLWGGGSLDYRFCSNGSALMAPGGAGRVDITLSQKYPIFAIAIDRPKAIENFSSYTFIFDPNGSGAFKSRAIYNENSGSVALIYAKMAESDNILASTTVADAQRVQMKLSVVCSSAPTDPNLKVYFAGTFRSATEAENYFKSYIFE